MSMTEILLKTISICKFDHIPTIEMTLELRRQDGPFSVIFDLFLKIFINLVVQ